MLNAEIDWQEDSASLGQEHTPRGTHQSRKQKHKTHLSESEFFFTKYNPALQRYRIKQKRGS